MISSSMPSHWRPSLVARERCGNRDCVSFRFCFTVVTKSRRMKINSIAGVGCSSYLGSLLFLLGISLGYLILCPYTKVEESFAMQATYDLFYHGLGPAIRRVLLLVTNDGPNDEDDLDELFLSLPYDHLQYPGVVPRTFAGPALLTTFTTVTAKVINLSLGITLEPHRLQFLMRFGLLLFVVQALHRLAQSIQFKFGGTRGEGSSPLLRTWFLLICASQFHIPFYGSRTLPNTFALCLVTHAYAEWFNGKPYMASWILVVCAAVVRCDVIILLTTIGLSMLLRGEMTLLGAVLTGISGGVSALLTTVPLDSILWVQRGKSTTSVLKSLVWPEGIVLLFNTVQNKSSDWGVLPWHWYFSRALPRSMITTLLLVPIACTTIMDYLIWCISLYRRDKNHTKGVSSEHETNTKKISTTYLSLPPLIHNIHNNSTIMPYILPVLGFIILYSFLPHKEMRFILPALPMFNVAAAIGFDRIYVLYCRCHHPSLDGETKNTLRIPKQQYTETKETRKNHRRGKSILSTLLVCGGTICIAVTFLCSCIFGIVSHYNYPGGVALSLLEPFLAAAVAEDITSSRHHQSIHVCFDVASSMTGITLFYQEKVKQSAIQNIENRLGTHSNSKEIEFIKEGYEQENQLLLGSLENNNKWSNRKTSCDFLLSEDSTIPGFEVIATAPGDPTLDLYHHRIVTKNKIFVMKSTMQKDDF